MATVTKQKQGWEAFTEQTTYQRTWEREVNIRLNYIIKRIGQLLAGTNFHLLFASISNFLLNSWQFRVLILAATRVAFNKPAPSVENKMTTAANVNSILPPSKPSGTYSRIHRTRTFCNSSNQKRDTGNKITKSNSLYKVNPSTRKREQVVPTPKPTKLNIASTDSKTQLLSPDDDSETDIDSQESLLSEQDLGAASLLGNNMDNETARTLSKLLWEKLRFMALDIEHFEELLTTSCFKKTYKPGEIIYRTGYTHTVHK